MKRISKETAGLLLVFVVLLMGLTLPTLARSTQSPLQLPASSTPSGTPTNTVVPPSFTPTDTATNTVVPASSTPSDTPTNTVVPPSFTPTDTATNTAVAASSTPTDTATNTAVAASSTPSDTPTITLSPTASNTPTATRKPTRVPSSTPTPTPTPRPRGFQACPANYWRQHPGAWAATGFAPNQTLERGFNVPNVYGLDNNTLLQALGYNLGFDKAGAARWLLRNGVAGVLNSAHPSIRYPFTTRQVILGVNAALASNNRNVMLVSAALLDAANSRDCPLN